MFLFRKARNESNTDVHVTAFIENTNNIEFWLGNAHTNANCTGVGSTALTNNINDSNAWYNFSATVYMTDGYNFYLIAYLNNNNTSSYSMTLSANPCSPFVTRDSDSMKMYIGSGRYNNSL